MLTLIDLLTAVLPLLYGLATVNYVVYFVRRDAFAERTCSRFLFTIFVTHVGFFVLRSLTFHRYPIVSMPEALSAVALSITGTYLYVERIQRSKVTGAFLITMVALVQIVASTLLQHGDTPSPLLEDNSVYGFHAIIAVLSYSALVVGAVYGLMFTLLYRALKLKRFGLLFERLPPLDTLAGMGFGATLLGWAFMTLTIGLGVVMSLSRVPTFWRDPHTITATLVWTVYGVAVGAYFVLGWRGARAVYLSLAGFLFALVANVAAALGWPSFHQFTG